MRKLIESKQEALLLTEVYGHYWEHNGFDDKQWDKLKKEVKGILQNAMRAGIELAGAYGNGKPSISDYSIELNGKAPKDDYETFRLTKEPQEFEFTRTAQRPYDQVVVSIMAAAKKINKNFKPKSDGGPSAIKRIF